MRGRKLFSGRPPRSSHALVLLWVPSSKGLAASRLSGRYKNTIEDRHNGPCIRLQAGRHSNTVSKGNQVPDAKTQVTAVLSSHFRCQLPEQLGSPQGVILHTARYPLPS